MSRNRWSIELTNDKKIQVNDTNSCIHTNELFNNKSFVFLRNFFYLRMLSITKTTDMTLSELIKIKITYSFDSLTF